MKAETLKSNVSKSAALFNIEEKEFVEYSKRQPTTLMMKPETLFTHAKMLQYSKEIKGTKNANLFDCLTIHGTKYIFADTLKFLISKSDDKTLGKGNPEKAVKDYLNKVQNKTYEFVIPNNEYANEFIEFAQELSAEVLDKNIFKFLLV